MNIAIITNVNIFVAKNLCEYLLHRKYHVYGIFKCNTNLPLNHPNLILINNDMNNYASVFELFKKFEKIDTTIEVYNFNDFENDYDNNIEIFSKNIMSTLYILQSIISLSLEERVKVFQPHTTDLFGKVQDIPQKESTNFQPFNIKGISSLSNYWLIRHYRAKYNIFACNCILYNIEGPYKHENSLSQQISKSLMNDKYILKIGNLHSSRDWIHIDDILDGIFKMMNSTKSDDIIFASFESHTIKEFIEISYSINNIKIKWIGEGFFEKGYNSKTNQLLVEVSESMIKTTNNNYLLGNNTKAYKLYNWEPKNTFSDLIKIIIPIVKKEKKKKYICF